MTNASAAPGQLIVAAQAILAEYHQPIGPSKADTIEKLTELLASADVAPQRAELDGKFSAALYIGSFVLCVACAAVIGQTSKGTGATDYFQRVAGSCK